MNPEFEKYHLIDRYLRGELSGRELDSFYNEMSANPAFAEEVEFQKGVNELITEDYYNQLRDQMSQDLKQRGRSRKLKRWLLGSSLLLITVLAMTGYWLLNSDNGRTRSQSANIQENIEQENTAINQTPDQPEQHDDITEADTSQVKLPEKEPLPVKEQKPEKSTTEEKVPEKIVADTVPQTEPPDKKLKEKVTETSQYNADTTTKLKDKPVTAMEEQELADPCQEMVLEADWKTEKACEGQNTGSISVDKSRISGGSAPYKIKLSSGSIEIPADKSKELYSGTYLLEITDNNGCTETWDIYVGEKKCNSGNISISPAHGETWEYSGDAGNSYNISIFNRSGQVVYKSPQLSGKTTWEGRGFRGEPLQPGLYVYIVEYKNGKTEKGQITIIR